MAVFLSTLRNPLRKARLNKSWSLLLREVCYHLQRAVNDLAEIDDAIRAVTVEPHCHFTVTIGLVHGAMIFNHMSDELRSVV